MKLSVIIPTHNRASLLDKALTSLKKQTFPQSYYEILIIDNGSTDNTKSLIESWLNRFTNIAYFYENKPGLHECRHRGLKEAHSEILVYCDDDIEACPTWLEAVYNAFQDPDIVLVGGKVLPKFETTPPEWLIQMWKKMECTERILGPLSLIDLGDKIKLISPYKIFGCNLSIRKSVLLECRGFHPDALPEKYLRFRGDGETWISQYISKSPYKTLYHPGASVYHWVPEKRMSLTYFCERSFRQGISNSFSFSRNPSQAALNNPFHYKTLRTILIRFLKTILRFQIRTGYIQLRIWMSLLKGFLYHQKQIKADPLLYKWVLKNNYLDEGEIK